MSSPPTAFYENTTYNTTFVDANYGGGALAHVSVVLSLSNSIYGSSSTVTPLSQSTLILVRY